MPYLDMKPIATRALELLEGQAKGDCSTETRRMNVTNMPTDPAGLVRDHAELLKFPRHEIRAAWTVFDQDMRRFSLRVCQGRRSAGSSPSLSFKHKTHGSFFSPANVFGKGVKMSHFRSTFAIRE